MTAAFMRGEVHWVELDPVVGSEISKTRHCVVLSANEINTRRKTVVVVPLTSTSNDPSFPLLIAVPSAGLGTSVRTDQIRCIDKSRLRGHVGRVSQDDLNAISRAITKVLDLH